MKGYVPFLIVASVLVLVVPACGPLGGGESGAPKELKLTGAEAGKTVEVAQGGVVEVTLKGNPTTGYMWEVGSLDDKVLKPEGEPGFKADSDADGAPGMITLKFKAEGAGKTDLKLVYHRPWETEEPPAQTFNVTVTVK